MATLNGNGNVMLAMQRKGLGSELDATLIQQIENPINFRPLTQDLAHGYEADILVAVCKAIIRVPLYSKST